MNKTKLIAWLFPRLTLGIFLTPRLHEQLFIPFLFQSDIHLFDPWDPWVSNLGRSDAFPYGLTMYTFFVPAILLFQLFAISPHMTILMTLILVEYFLYRHLGIFQKTQNLLWTWVCIFSPLPIYITYIHGQFDTIPAFGVLLCCLFVLNGDWKKSGFVLGFAIAAKFSVALVLPIFVAYFLSRKYRWKFGMHFLLGLMPGLTILMLPYFFSPGYVKMVFGTPEIINTLKAQIDFGVASIYILPIAYFAILLIFWSLREVSKLTLVAFVSGTLLLIAMVQTSSIGWFYWGFVLIFLFIKEFNIRFNLVFCMWQISTILYFSLKFDFAKSNFIIKSVFELDQKIGLLDLLFTLNLALGLSFLFKFIQIALKVGDIYGLSKKPFSIAIAGDSGVGKDSLTNEISKLFGRQEVSLLFGEDYHLYERDNLNWEVTTHLSAHANDLVSLGKDFGKLIKRESVSVNNYDHTSGKFIGPRRVNPSEIIIVNGLHALLFPGSELSDVKVFLSMDDDIRMKFKIERDLEIRSHKSVQQIKSSIKFRKDDYEKFVSPQKMNSDLHFHITCEDKTSNHKIILNCKDVAFLLELQNLMQSSKDNDSFLSMTKEGLIFELKAQDFNARRAVDLLSENLPSSDQIFVDQPNFSVGSLGFMSFVCILYLSKARLRGV